MKYTHSLCSADTSNHAIHTHNADPVDAKEREKKCKCLYAIWPVPSSQTSRKKVVSCQISRAPSSLHTWEIRLSGPTLIEPAILRCRRTVLQQLTRHVLGTDFLPARADRGVVAALVVDDHPGAQEQRQHTADGTEGRGRDERGKVFRCIFVLEDVGAREKRERERGSQCMYL